MEPPSRSWLRFRLTFASIGLFVGVLVFFVFAFGLSPHSYHAAVWGLVSGVFAGLTLIVHVQYWKEQWSSWYHYKLPILQSLGALFSLGSFVAFFTYLPLAIVQHQKLWPDDDGYYLTLVWVFMTWKWSLALFWYSNSYGLLYRETYMMSNSSSAGVHQTSHSQA